MGNEEKQCMTARCMLIFLIDLYPPMTCWPALLTGLYRDYRELFTESGPFFLFFLAQISCVYLEFNFHGQ